MKIHVKKRILPKHIQLLVFNPCDDMALNRHSAPTAKRVGWIHKDGKGYLNKGQNTWFKKNLGKVLYEKEPHPALLLPYDCS